MRRLPHLPLFAVVICTGLVAGFALAASEESSEFGDAQADAERYMRYYSEIELTPEQEKVKREALEALPAACCSDNSAYTCCCPCNLSRTVWGLSAHLIANEGADAATVRTAVEQWYQRVNPDGFPGNTCYTGGCGKPFSHGGCGGMNPTRLSWAQ